MNIPADPTFLLFDLWQNLARSSYLQPGLLIGGIFLLFLFLSVIRKHIFRLSMKGAIFGFVVGVLVMLLLDIIIIFGVADRERLKQVSSAKNRQEMVQEIFISGVSGIGHVLGVSTAVTPKTSKPKMVEEVVSGYLSLPQSDALKFKALLCPQ